jgi:hypothetical protein
LLCELFDADAEAFAAVVEAARANLSVSAPAMTAYVDALERQLLPNLAGRLRTRTPRTSGSMH